MVSNIFPNDPQMIPQRFHPRSNHNLGFHYYNDNCDNDGDHASEIIPADESHYIKIPNNDKDALVNAVKSFDVDRKEVQEMTWEKHSLDGWKKQFSDAVSITIDKFKRPNLLDFLN